MPDLESIISGAVATAEADGGSDGAESTDSSSEHTETSESTTADNTTSTTVTGTTVVPDAGTDDAAKAALKATEDAENEFAKEHDLLDKTGKRENRIPYTRVKKIIDKATADFIKLATGEDLPAGKKAKDVLTAFTAGLTRPRPSCKATKSA
jgi:hypothetical protein